MVNDLFAELAAIGAIASNPAPEVPAAEPEVAAEAVPVEPEQVPAAEPELKDDMLEQEVDAIARQIATLLHEWLAKHTMVTPGPGPKSPYKQE